MQTQKIKWSAPEFRYYEKNVAWYITLIIIGGLVVSYFVYEKDIFAAVCIAILGILVGLFSLQEPKIVEVELSQTGIAFGNIHFPYKQLRHFWTVNNTTHRTLNIETSTVINHILIIELMDQDEEEVRQFLLKYLPEHHLTTETFAQRISHKLKF